MENSGAPQIRLRKSVQESCIPRNDFPKPIWSGPEALKFLLLTPL